MALVSFTMNAQNIIFEDDFESYTTTDNVGEDTDIPDTYLSYDQDGDTYNWGLSNPANFTQSASYLELFTNNFIVSASYLTLGEAGNGGTGTYEAANILSPDNILVTPMISIPAGATGIELSFVVGSGSDPDYFSETYSVAVTTSSDVTDILAATPILDTTLLFQGSETVTLNIDDYAGQDVYISFRHYNCTDMFTLGIDNIKVEAASLAIEDLQALNFKYYPNPVNNVLNMSANTAIENISVINLLGQEVMNVVPNALQTSIDTSNLDAGVYLVDVKIGDSTGTIKIVKE